MEADFMEWQGRFLNKVFLILCGFSFACDSYRQQESLPFLNIDSVVEEKKNGILRIDGEPYSGFLFSLDKVNFDTLSLEKYIEGKPEGLQKRFYPGGPKMSERMFKDGKKEGIYLSWYPNGNKKAESNFREGEYQGTLREWTETGVLIREMNYEKGHEAGRQQAWDSDGKQLANYEVRNGRTYGLTGIKGCSTPWNEGAVAVH